VISTDVYKSTAEVEACIQGMGRDLAALLQGRGIDNPLMIEEVTGMQVYANILESKQQESLSSKILARETGKFILAESYPDDLSIESLRSFRVALQFAMLDAANNRVMISGEVPLAELSGYDARLKSITGGDGTYSIELSHYDSVPAQIQKQLTDAYQRQD